MLPGVNTSCLPDVQKGDLLAVCIPGNRAPIAIGAAAMHSMAAAQQAAGQGKGKLIEIIQHYGDTLWQGLGRCAVPNDGFLQGAVAPEGAAAAAGEADDAAALMQELGLDSAATAAAAAGSVDSSEGASAAAAGGGSSSSSPWPDDMDQLMELALLQVTRKGLCKWFACHLAKHAAAAPPQLLLDALAATQAKACGSHSRIVLAGLKAAFCC